MKIFLAAVALVLVAALPAFATDVMDSRMAIADAQKIGPDGIDVLKTVRIGGIDQWISVRGNKRTNPILLFIHGGPGSPMMPLAWTFQHPWEDYFTVVQWDQRGAGKTFVAAGLKPDTTMTIDRLQVDAEEMVAYLRSTYHQDKIFIMAHSFGSIIGMRIAQQHPEWLQAYIGVGQVINGRRNEEVSYAETLALAQKANDRVALRELKSIAPYPKPGRATPIENVLLERRWVEAYGGVLYGMKSDDPTPLMALSPLYNDADLQAFLPGAMSSVQSLLPESVDVSFDNNTNFKCPVFFFAGVDDRATPASIVKDFFAKVHAPKKKLYVVEHAAHYVVTEAPGTVLVDLVNDILPLAQR
jgi:pimeloyl-ACP methyl ester carboxylesterase